MGKLPYIFAGEMDSPIGPLTITGVKDGICGISFGTYQNAIPSIHAWAKKHLLKSELVYDPKYAEDAIKQLDDYFSEKRCAFDLPLFLCGTPFQLKVWDALRQIPYGETRTYKEVAQMIGNPKAVRAVGTANNKNPIPIIIPCHRVIGSNGTLVGYGGGIEKKQCLLEHESI